MVENVLLCTRDVFRDHCWHINVIMELRRIFTSWLCWSVSYCMITHSEGMEYEEPSVRPCAVGLRHRQTYITYGASAVSDPLPWKCCHIVQ